jgi:hypothetical protein
MNKDEALEIALEALELHGKQYPHMVKGYCLDAITAIKKALETKDEPVAVKRMMEWVYVLKRRSDNGQHMNIQSGLTAGTCWEFAIELEEFIKHFSSQRTWVGLTDEEQSFVYDQVKQTVGGKPFWVKFADAIEDKLKERNT